jgi:hypothetical protein
MAGQAQRKSRDCAYAALTESGRFFWAFRCTMSPWFWMTPEMNTNFSSSTASGFCHKNLARRMPEMEDGSVNRARRSTMAYRRHGSGNIKTKSKSWKMRGSLSLFEHSPAVIYVLAYGRVRSQPHRLLTIPSKYQPSSCKIRRSGLERTATLRARSSLGSPFFHFRQKLGLRYRNGAAALTRVPSPEH